MGRPRAVIPERIGLELRRLLGLNQFDPLDPFALAKKLNIVVLTPDEIRGLPTWAYDQLVDRRPTAWSAAAAVVDSRAVILVNHRHTPQRMRATLMEEIAHVWLDHSPSRLCERPAVAARTFDESQERQAFAVGSAALVPRGGLTGLIGRATRLPDIARTYRVSSDLVTYRLKVTGLWLQALANEDRDLIPLF